MGPFASASPSCAPTGLVSPPCMARHESNGCSRDEARAAAASAVHRRALHVPPLDWSSTRASRVNSALPSRLAPVKNTALHCTASLQPIASAHCARLTGRGGDLRRVRSVRTGGATGRPREHLGCQQEAIRLRDLVAVRAHAACVPMRRRRRRRRRNMNDEGGVESRTVQDKKDQDHREGEGERVC